VSLTYSINGFVLANTTQADGIFLVEGTEYAPTVSPRRATVEVPGFHYEIPQWHDPLTAITISMSLRCQARDAFTLRAYWNQLMGMLGQGTNRPVILERIRPDAIESAEAQLMSSSPPEFSHTTQRLDVQIIWNIPGGAWRGPFLDQGFPAGGGQSSMTAEQSTRPIADAFIRLPGPVGLVRVADDTSSTGIEWTRGSLVVPQGGFLLINVATLTATIVESDTWDPQGGTPASGRLVFTGYGPLTMTSRWAGGVPVSALTVEFTESPGPLTIRSRSAVV
jgi:hypothetical protein